MRIGRALQALLAILVASFFSVATPGFGQAGPLGWEIERNFRYFKYNSDVALQRVAADLFEAQHAHPPDAAELERFLNDPGFWTKTLSTAKHRERWPKSWLNAETPHALISQLRNAEGGRGPMPQANILEWIGWAALLVKPQNQSGQDGATDTCWNPIKRKHINCNEYGGDYARPRGWTVRVFDEAPPPGANCTWRADGGAYIGQMSEAAVYKPAVKLGPWVSPSNQDCHEARIYVPSNAADPRNVRGSINVFRRVGNDQETPALAVNPQDILIVGFADSFGSGEGNPERGAQFRAVPIANILLPARLSPDAEHPGQRAQWTDRWCHRSVYSWQIKSALQLALMNPQKSVTILPYGCSGAEVFEGILYRYGGIEPTPRSSVPPGHSAQLGLAYQELCKTYYKFDQAPAIQPQPAWQDDDAIRKAAKSGKTIDFNQRKDEILKYVWNNLTRCERSGPNQFLFKRNVDYVLLAAGINDIGFSRWVVAAIADQHIADVLHGFIPRTGDLQTEMRLQRLEFRNAILREALDKRFLVDAGLIGAGAPAGGTLPQVVLPLYPRALENEAGDICARGNQGMTVGTFPLGTQDAFECKRSGILGFKSNIFSFAGVRGPVFAIRSLDDMKAIEHFRDKGLNGSVLKFAASSPVRPGYTVVPTPTEENGGFHNRGFCATKDPDSAIVGHKCLAFDWFLTAPPPTCPPDAGCILRSADSMHVARGAMGDAKPEWIGLWRPFQNYFAYAHRTRLFRTPNDVYMLINARPSGSLDSTLPGILDLDGRATSGAFHPTAEAHAIVAKAVAQRLPPP